MRFVGFVGGGLSDRRASGGEDGEEGSFRTKLGRAAEAEVEADARALGNRRQYVGGTGVVCVVAVVSERISGKTCRELLYGLM